MRIRTLQTSAGVVAPDSSDLLPVSQARSSDGSGIATGSILSWQLLGRARKALRATPDPSSVPALSEPVSVGLGLVRKPLSRANLERTVTLGESVFGTEAGVARELEMAVSGEPFMEEESGDRILRSRSWVVEEEATGEILATVGLYAKAEDGGEALWLSWFCVSEKARGRGLGKKLLDFATEAARSSGRRYLRLYTEDLPYEAAAQKLYEAHGLRATRIEPIEGSRFHRIFRELELGPGRAREAGNGDVPLGGVQAFYTRRRAA